MTGSRRKMTWVSGVLASSSLAMLSTHAAAPVIPGQPAAEGMSAHRSAAQSAAGRGGADVGDSAVEALHVVGSQSIGHGLMKRQTSPEATYAVTRTAIAEKAAAASTLQLTTTLPGVNFGTSNAFGLALRNWISVRGLDETEMGWVFEGMPGTDQALNYPYTDTWADPENIEDLTLIAGTTRLEDPNVTASGGEIIETVRNPSSERGASADVSVGSHDAVRGFARVDTGYLGSSGVKLFASTSYTAGNNFEGEGRSHKLHVDFKAAKDWEAGQSSLTISYTDWYDAFLNTSSLAQWETGNAEGGQFEQFNYANSYYPGVASYRGAYGYDTQRVLVSFQNAFQLTSRLTFHVTPYFHYIFSNGTGLANLNVNSLYAGNQKIRINPSTVYVYDAKGDFQAGTDQTEHEYAYGLNSYLQYNLSNTNNLMVGYWYDHWNMKAVFGYNELNQYGEANSLDGSYPLMGSNGLLLAGTAFQDSVQTNAAYASDTQKLLDNRLTISAGLKELMFYTSGTDDVPGPLYHFSSAISSPLPRVYISYNLSKQIQIYVNATTNSKPPLAANSYPNEYTATTGALSQIGNDKIKPEYTIGEELGARYHGVVDANLTLFNMNLTNHQVNTEQYENGLLVRGAISVGGETIRGLAAEVALRPIGGFTPYANIQYLHATIDNNIEVEGDYLPTTGKTMVETPPVIANVGVRYARGPFFADLTFKYVDSQYSTFINDQSMPAYKTVDLALGYHLPKLFGLRSPMVRLNMTNLTDVAYLGAVAGPQLNANTMTGIFGKSIAGTQPTYYISAPFALMATLSADF